MPSPAAWQKVDIAVPYMATHTHTHTHTECKSRSCDFAFSVCGVSGLSPTWAMALSTGEWLAVFQYQQKTGGGGRITHAFPPDSSVTCLLQPQTQVHPALGWRWWRVRWPRCLPGVIFHYQQSSTREVEDKAEQERVGLYLVDCTFPVAVCVLSLSYCCWLLSLLFVFLITHQTLTKSLFLYLLFHCLCSLPSLLLFSSSYLPWLLFLPLITIHLASFLFSLCSVSLLTDLSCSLFAFIFTHLVFFLSCFSHSSL